MVGTSTMVTWVQESVTLNVLFNLDKYGSFKDFTQDAS